MPFISGESLKTAVEKNGPLPVVDVVRVLYDVAEALDYAHGQGVVHRDIKPANILRSGSYSLITDFGVAKALNASMPASGMTSTGMAVGTPAYMAPEQLAGDASADHRIDIYALGLLAYELLNGKSPFAASTPQRVLAAVLTQEPKPLIEVRPDVPPSLSELVMRCLSKDPIERPPSARQVLDSLDMFSTASGEIRTMEHRLPRSARMTPTAVPVTAAPEDTPSTEIKKPESKTPHDQLLSVESAPGSFNVHNVGYDPPKKNRSKLVLGVVALLVPAAVAAFVLSQRSSNGSSADAAAVPQLGVPIGDSSSAAPAALPESAAAAPVIAIVDSQAIRDSIRRVRREEAAKRAAAVSDSLRKVQETIVVGNARRAAASMLADANALKSFTRGATHMGGVLGTQRRGDLQTQIDALLPFLMQAGLTYEQFKDIVADSGVWLFDEFGRMMPEALRQFAASGG